MWGNTKMRILLLAAVGLMLVLGHKLPRAADESVSRGAKAPEARATNPSRLLQDPSLRVDKDRVDRAIAAGLAWLARAQESHGGWVGDVGSKRGDGYVLTQTAEGARAAGGGHLGVSAMCGMAFLASGHMPERGQYGPVVAGALRYVLSRQDGSGYLTDSGTNMYSHAFGTLFLAEIHGMSGTRHADVRNALTEATRFIVRMQNEYGAWRYAPGTNRADLSVTVCQVQALRAARNVGTPVPKTAIDRVVDYVERSRINGGRYDGAFYYKIVGTAAYSRTSYAINAAAVTSLHSAGLYNEERYGSALSFIERDYAAVSRNYGDHYFYWYGTYYAAQALRQVGGDRWQRFYDQMASDLLGRQQSDGSWLNDTGPGKAFSTAMACLLLAIPHGYLPIFQD